MSGVFGCWHRDGRPVSPATLDACLGSISPRASRKVDTWIDGAIGLGRKSPVHPDPGQPPIGDARVACVFDGRLDNRAELLDRLARQWSLARDCADHRLIAAAYLQFGEDCVERLEGDFAF